MFECPKCKKFFRDCYSLTRHQSRMKPCIPGLIEKNDDIPLFELKNSPLGLKNSPLELKNSAFEKTCQFCLNTFCSNFYKNQHEQICKHRNDKRILEIGLGIKPDLPENKTECRFCHKVLFRTDKLKNHTQVCKDRETYHQELTERLKQNQEKVQQPIINNGTINNGTINNGTINNIIVFNQSRSIEHIEAKQIIQFLRDLKTYHLPNQAYEKAGDLIVMMEKYIQEDSKNNNFIIPDHKSVVGYIKKENGWEITDINHPLNQVFKETAGIIYDKRCEIDNVNEKVFQNNGNLEIFQHVKQFNNKGFYHNMYGNQKVKNIKNKFKMTKLKNKNVIDF